jgi:hypothetical protein
MVLWVDFPRSASFGRDETAADPHPRTKRGRFSQKLGGGTAPPDDTSPSMDDN